MKQNDKVKVISIQEASKMLDHCYATTLEMAKDGRLPCVRFGKRFLVLREALEEILKVPPKDAA